MEHDIGPKIGDVTNLLSEAVYAHGMLYANDEDTRKGAVQEEDDEAGTMVLLIEGHYWQVKVVLDD